MSSWQGWGVLPGTDGSLGASLKSSEATSQPWEGCPAMSRLSFGGLELGRCSWSITHSGYCFSGHSFLSALQLPHCVKVTMLRQTNHAWLFSYVVGSGGYQSPCHFCRYPVLDSVPWFRNLPSGFRSNNKNVHRQKSQHLKMKQTNSKTYNRLQGYRLCILSKI